MKDADKIIFMNFSRIICLGQAIKRYITNRNKTRESMAEGCTEKLDGEFLWWLIYKGRRKFRRQKFREICDKYSEKTVILKNQKEVNRFLERCSTGINVV